MREYEMMFIVAQRDIKEGTHDAKVEEIRAIVEKLEGRVLRVRPWGLRELAYPIDGFDYGYYVILQLTLEEGKVREFESRLQGVEKVLRHLIIAGDDRASADVGVFETMADESDIEAVATRSGGKKEHTEAAVATVAEADTTPVVAAPEAEPPSAE